MMVNVTNSNQRVESYDELKFTQTFFKYSRSLARLLKKIQLAPASDLLVSINLHLNDP